MSRQRRIITALRADKKKPSKWTAFSHPAQATPCGLVDHFTPARFSMEVASA